MTNNDIFKKLRVALMLRDDQIIEIMELVDFRISKSELGAFFRDESHENYMECGDQALRNFLNGLVIHLRGTKENPKNPMVEINKNRADASPREQKVFPRDEAARKTDKPFEKPKSDKPFKKKPAKKSEPKIQVVEKVRFSNGKKKS